MIANAILLYSLITDLISRHQKTLHLQRRGTNTDSQADIM